MKRDNLLILANSKFSKIGLGDYLRILSFLPNLDFKNFFWASNKELFPLIKEVDFISKISNIDSIDIHSIRKDYFIFDLVKGGNNSKSSFYLNTILDKNKNVKQNMSTIIEDLAKFFSIKKYKLFSNGLTNYENKYDIFLNWHTPEEWIIKRYPEQKWDELVEKLQKNFNLKIQRQIINDSFEEYIKKIKFSKIIVSVVSLGCHIANLFNKPLIMLSGSNFHYDSDLQLNQINIFPKTYCKFRPCNLPQGVNNCGCMGDIDVNQIYKNVIKLLNEKI